MASQKELPEIFITAHLWQRRGWQTIPAQPDSKRLIPGFGLYLEKVESGESVEYWFRDRNANLAVVAPPDGVVLDFDRIEVYKLFCDRWPELAASYTEGTPRGGKHIFLRTSQPIPSGLVLVPGIEIKRVVLVYPSTVGGNPYEVALPGEILQGDVIKALESFLVPGGDKSSPGVSVRVLVHPGAKYGLNIGDRGSPGLIAQVKARWPILAYLSYFEPKLFLIGRGTWYSGKCPWHEDSRPSLWVNTERNKWGCHGCKAAGDVVNWHARRLGTNDQAAAARDLAKYRVEVTS
jgi:hypothetical protein